MHLSEHPHCDGCGKDILNEDTELVIVSKEELNVPIHEREKKILELCLDCYHGAPWVYCPGAREWTWSDLNYRAKHTNKENTHERTSEVQGS